MLEPEQRESIISSKRSLDSICDEFEAALKSGKRIRIESFTDRARSASSRTRMLQALLEIELEHILKDRIPNEDEYLVRFPDDVASVRKAFEVFRERYPQRFATTLSQGEGETFISSPNRQLANVKLPLTFGRYVLQERLGAGGMGQVFRAYDNELRRDVALKLPLLDSDDPNQIERFRGEARTAATIEHPGVCQIYDIGELDGQQYITMKLVDGKSLSDLMKEGKSFTTRQAVSLVRKIADALTVAHAKGVIHRDIKPANIMLTSKSEPIVVDFGLAHQSSESRSRLTQTGAAVGTPAYMPIEQAMGDLKNINQRSDVYSLTAVLFRILAGEPPYQGTPLVIIGQIIAGRIPSLTEYRSDLDEELLRIVAKGMAYKQEDRYASMRELSNDLKEYLRRTADAGTATQTARPASRTNPQPEAQPATLANFGAGRRNRKLLLGAAFLFPFLFWLGTIIFVRTEHGTLRIEVLDPQLQVTVDGEVVTVKDGDKSLELKTGPKRLFIKNEDLGLEFEKEFTLSKDGEKRLHVVLVDGKNIEVREGAAPSMVPSRENAEIAGLPHFQPLGPIPPEPEFDGSPESIQARKKWYIDKYLSRNGASLSQQELFSLPAPEEFGPAVTMAEVDQAIADAVSPANVVGRMFKDAKCTAPLNESELPNWKADHYRGIYNKAGQLVYVKPVPRVAPAADLLEEMVYAYDHSGNRNLEIAIALNGRPKNRFDGIAIVQKHYSGKVLRETRYYDASVKPVENRYGVHRSLHRDDGLVLKFFKDGRVVDEWLDSLNVGRRVNAEYAEGVALSPDGTRIYFTTGYDGGRIDFNVQVKYCVWNGSRWSDPEPILAKNRPLTGRKPRLSPDGSKLIVVGYKSAPWFDKNTTSRSCFPNIPNSGAADLYAVNRMGEGWSDVVSFDGNINSAKSEEGGIAFFVDGKTAIVSVGEDSTHDSEVFSLQTWREINGTWSLDQSVPAIPGLNPYVSPDDSSVWYCRRGLAPGGRSNTRDIYTTRLDGKNWGTTIELPDAINTPGLDETSPSLSHDGSILYFSRCLRPWTVHVSGKISSETAVRHLAEIFARKEWQSPGLPLPSEDVVATSIEAAPREDTPLTQRGVILHKDEFEDPKSLSLGNEFRSAGQPAVSDGRYHVLTHSLWCVNLLPTLPGKAPIDGDFDVEVPGRVVGPENSHWGLMLTSFDGKQHTHGIALEISRNGTLEIAPQWYLESTSDPWSDVFSHPAILKGDRFNTVRASLRGGRKLSVWVNDQAVVLDHELKHPLLKTTVALTAKARKDRTESLWPCRAEFDRLVVSQPTSKDSTHSDLSTQQALLTVRSSNPAADLNASKLKLASNDKASLTAARLELIKLRAEFPGSEEAITAGQLLETEAIRGASIAYKISDTGDGELTALPSEIGDELPPELVGHLGDSRLKHWDDIWGVDFSPTGQEVASASADGTVRVWSVQTGKLTRLLGNHQGQCFAVKWAPDGKTMATADKKGTVHLWNSDTWALAHQCTGHNLPVATLAFTSDSRQLVSGGDEDALLVWDVESGKQIARLGPPQSEVVHQERLPGRPPRIAGYRDIQFGKEDKQLYCATLSGNLEVWNIEDGRRLEVKRLSDEKLRTVAISNDGTKISVGGEDRIIRVLDAQSLNVVSEFDGTPGLVRRARFVNDDKNLLVCYNTYGRDNVRSWDVATGTFTSLVGHNAAVYDLKISPDGKTAVTAGLDNSIRLWDVPTGKQLHEFDAPSMEMRSVRLLTDGSCVAADWNGEVTRWSANQKQLWRKKLSNNWINAIDVSKDEQKLLFASFDGEIGLLNISDGSIAEMLNPRIPGTRTAKWSPDNKLIATGAFSGTVTFWDANTGKAIADVAKLGGEIECLAWSPDQQRLAVGMESVSTTKPANVSYIIDVGTSTVIAKLPCGQSSTRGIAFSADGASVFTFGFDGMLRRFDLERAIEGKESLLPQSMLVSLAGGLGLDVSPSGKQLVTSAKDGTVRFVDVETWQITKQVKIGPNHGWVNSVSYSPDGTHVSTANANGTVSLLVAPSPTVSGAAVLKHLTILDGKADKVLHAVFHADKKLVIGTRGGEVQVWDLNSTATPIARRQLGFGWLGGLTITLDGKHVVAGANTTIQWLSYPELNLEDKKIEGVGGRIQGMSINEDGTQIVSVSTQSFEVRSLAGVAGTPVKNSQPSEEFCSASFLQNQDVVIGTKAGSILRYSKAGKKLPFEYHSFHGGYVRAMHQSPMGWWSLSGSQGTVSPERTIRPAVVIHDSHSLAALRVIHESCLNLSNAQISNSGRFMVSTGLGGYSFGPPGQTISIWDLWENRRLQTTTASTGSLRSAAFSHDDKHLAIGNGGGGVDIFECNFPEPNAVKADPLRHIAIAARILSVGGWLEMRSDSADHVIQVRSKDDLPNGMFSIHSVTLTNTKNLSDQMIEDLGMLPGLSRLNLSGAGVTDVQLAKIAQFQSLQALDLTDCKVSDTGLGHLRQHAQLTHLILQNCNITDAGLTHLQSIPGLTVLGLRGTKISDTGLGVFSRLPELVALDLRNTTISDAISPALKIATRLQILQLDNSKVTDGVIPILTACPNLRRVGLSGTSIAEAAVQQLATAQYLRSVTLPAAAGSPESLEKMKQQMPWCLINAL